MAKIDISDIKIRDLDLRNYIIHRRAGSKKRKLTEKITNEIKDYLSNPTRAGIWTLRTKWMEFEGFSLYIKEELEKALEAEKATNNGETKQNELEDAEKVNLIETVKGLNFVFRMFTYLCILEKKDKSLMKFIETDDDEFKIICKIIDLKALKAKYQEAFDYFKQNIYYEGFEFDMVVDRNKITQIKQGFFVYNRVDEEDSLHEKEIRIIYLTSTSPESLESLKAFYEKLNKIKETKITSIYSPKERVFEPYVALLEPVYQSFISELKIKNLIKDSILEYKEKRYAYCINLIGLIAEEYLVQIYETLFRATCPEFTLGEIYRLIGEEEKKAVEMSTPKEPTFETLFEEIKRLHEKINNGNQNLTRETLTFLNKIVLSIQDNKKYICEKIDSSQNKNINPSIFHRELKDNIEELIENRNAVSHRRDAPIGASEALRTVYCCITLILWWNKEEGLIDKRKHQTDYRDTIKEIIKRNKRV